MENYIIIRAGVNGGKTTTCGILYEELSKKAAFAQLYNYRFEKIGQLNYNPKGDLYDFIGVLIINGKVIIIISQGDVAEELEKVLNSLNNSSLVERLTNDLKNKIDFYVVCARSQFRKNSTIEMLHKNIPADQRKEFWTSKSDDIRDKRNVKMKIVDDITGYII